MTHTRPDGTRATWAAHETPDGEVDFKNLFPGCEPGAMPPFGNLYDMKVIVAESLAEDEEIAFNAGSHTELVRLRYADFKRLVEPTTASFTTRLQEA